MIDIDQRVLDQLLMLGSNITKAHNIDFFLYFPTKESAQLAAKVIEREGFEVEIQPGEGDEQCLCLAMKKMVPEHMELIEIRKWFESIAEELNGKYDGWGTGVIE